MTDKAVLGDLPSGVKSVMFLRDGWPYVVVCKVVMDDDCVGIGVYRAVGLEQSPELYDRMAMVDAIQHVGASPPDYTEIQEHAARLKAAAEARARS